MILADTSVWIDHLRVADETMARLLDEGQVLIHPFVVGQLAMGNLSRRQSVLRDLWRMPAVVKARDAEVLELVEREKLSGLGLGFFDVHLLASTLLTDEATLWTRDRRLHAVAQRLGVAAPTVSRTSH